MNDSAETRGPELWHFARPGLWHIEETAARAERDGWDGMVLTDSQNLSPDTYVALTLAARATTRLKLGPGVTNSSTRHAAVTAGAIASIQYVSAGRAFLGVGRGDSALFNIGLEPAPLRAFARYIEQVQTYLRGDSIETNGYPSRLHWLGRTDVAKVPLDIAATGPKVIALAARLGEGVSFSLGANPERIRWGVEQVARALPDGKRMPSLGAYVNVCVDDDIGRAQDLVRAGVGTFAHFSGMKGAQPSMVASGDRAAFDALHENYDRPRHGRADAAHAQQLPADFIDRFAIVGSPSHCRTRLQALLEAGLDRLVIIGPNPEEHGDLAHTANQRFVSDVMPALRS